MTCAQMLIKTALIWHSEINVKTIHLSVIATNKIWFDLASDRRNTLRNDIFPFRGCIMYMYVSSDVRLIYEVQLMQLTYF